MPIALNPNAQPPVRDDLDKRSGENPEDRDQSKDTGFISEAARKMTHAAAPYHKCLLRLYEREYVGFD